MNQRSARKIRSSSAKGGRGKGVERQVSADGVYTNHRFMQSLGALVGLTGQIQTKTNETYEGIFTTLSPNFDLVLDMAHPVITNDPTNINPEEIKRKMIFQAQDIVTIRVSNVDPDFATKESGTAVKRNSQNNDGFAVDAQIGGRYNGSVVEKTLEPWQPEQVSTGEELEASAGSSSPAKSPEGLEESSNGWDVNDMFRKNEDKFGVTTSYTPEMEGYTTPLNRRNTREYREKEAEASRIAAEIMSSPSVQARADLENGDEEDKFSAVVRPGNELPGGTPPSRGEGKYIPPQRRKGTSNSSGSKLQRPSPPPPGSGGGGEGGGGGPQAPRGSRGATSNSGSNPTTPTSPSYPGPPQQLHPGGAHSPGPSPQTTYPSPGPGGHGHNPGHPSGHTPLHRHNSGNTSHHSPHTPENKQINGEQRRGQEDSDNSSTQRHQTDHYNNKSGHGSHHESHGGRSSSQHNQHSPVAAAENQHQQQKPQPPKQQQQQQQQQQQHHPNDQRSKNTHQQEPREQREPRKSARSNKDEQTMQELKKFGQDFNLKESSQPQQQQQQQQPQPQPQPTEKKVVQHNTQQQQAIPPQQQQVPPQQPQHIPPPHPPQQQQMQQQQQTQPQQQQQQPQQQRQTPPQPATQQGANNPSASNTTGAAAATSSSSSTTADIKHQEEVDKMSSTISNSKLNPNAKEFIFNPNAKPFNPRSSSTTTPPRPHTPQTPQIPTNQPPQMGGQHPSFPQTIVSAPAYVMAQPPFIPQPQPPRFPKRVGGVNTQRTAAEFNSSQMQVAAATGPPILAPGPAMPGAQLSQPQAITTVQLPHTAMIPQPPQHYQPYAGMQTMMVQLPSGPGGVRMLQMVPTPTSMGMYHAAGPAQPQDQQQPQQLVYKPQQSGQHTMYMATVPPHQPHPAHTPGPQPPQPPTPQNPAGTGGGGPPSMPNQPPTPGPTPPQSLMYGGPAHMGGQPSLPQHMPQHSPHTHSAQSPHTHQYPGHSSVASAVAAAGAVAAHHQPGSTQLPPQIVMLPHNMAGGGPHMMPHPQGPPPPPHSANQHIPSSMAAAFTPTSSASMQHMNHQPHAAIQYLQGHGNQGHPMAPVIPHHSQ